MKTIVFIALATLAVAQEKPAPEPKFERMDDTTRTHMRAARAEAEKAQLQYKPADIQKQWNDYQKSVEAPQKEWSEFFEKGCSKLGIPKDKMQECVVDLDWIDPATKTPDHPDGVAVGRFTWVKAAPVPAEVAKPAAK